MTRCVAYEDIQSPENDANNELDRTFNSTSQTFNMSAQSGDKRLLSVETGVGDKMKEPCLENVCSPKEPLPVPDTSTSQHETSSQRATSSQRETSDLLKSHSMTTQHDRDLHLSLSSSMRPGTSGLLSSLRAGNSLLPVEEKRAETEDEGAESRRRNESQGSIEISYGFGYTPDLPRPCTLQVHRDMYSFSSNDSEGYVRVNTPNK